MINSFAASDPTCVLFHIDALSSSALPILETLVLVVLTMKMNICLMSSGVARLPIGQAAQNLQEKQRYELAETDQPTGILFTRQRPFLTLASIVSDDQNNWMDLRGAFVFERQSSNIEYGTMDCYPSVRR
ncbi:hypothetical protein V8B97DRAFT_745755 [Scleroderma yunnanense]